MAAGYQRSGAVAMVKHCYTGLRLQSSKERWEKLQVYIESKCNDEGFNLNAMTGYFSVRSHIGTQHFEFHLNLRRFHDAHIRGDKYSSTF